MKYAKEVMELMAAFPGRDFKMAEIVRYAAPSATVQQRHTVRRAILRVMDGLIESGVVMRRPHHANGGFAAYRWKD